MKVSELKANAPFETLTLTVTHVDEVREFNKFDKPGQVQNVKAKDDSGEVSITLWNEQANTLELGDMVKMEKGWVKEYNGDLQVSTGKFGTMSKMDSTEGDSTEMAVDIEQL